MQIWISQNQTQTDCVHTLIFDVTTSGCFQMSSDDGFHQSDKGSQGYSFVSLPFQPFLI